MHKEVIDFCQSVKRRYPYFFKGKSVLDVGSLDINGNNRYLFEDCEYIGIDLGPGKNVDIVCPVHEFDGSFDVVISTEMLEHDQYWKESLKAMTQLCSGLLILTAAGPNRYEHGTSGTSPQDSPFTNEYYRNVNRDMLIEGLITESSFSNFEITEPRNSKDICFWGLKI